MTKKLSKQAQLELDAERYRVLRRDGYHFSIAVRYTPEEEAQGKRDWIHTNHVAGELLDDLIDAWMVHPTFNIPRR